MKRILTLAVLALMVLGSANAQENNVIGKQNIKLQSRLMTPEALWAMGRIGTYEASPSPHNCGSPHILETSAASCACA